MKKDILVLSLGIGLLSYSCGEGRQEQPATTGSVQPGTDIGRDTVVREHEQGTDTIIGEQEFGRRGTDEEE